MMEGERKPCADKRSQRGCWRSVSLVVSNVAAHANAHIFMDTAVGTNGAGEGTVRCEICATSKVGANVRFLGGKGDEVREKGSWIGGPCTGRTTWGEIGGERNRARNSQGTLTTCTSHWSQVARTRHRCHLTRHTTHWLHRHLDIGNVHMPSRPVLDSWRVTRCTGPIQWAVTDGPVLGALTCSVEFTCDGTSYPSAAAVQGRNGLAAVLPRHGEKRSHARGRGCMSCGPGRGAVGTPNGHGRDGTHVTCSYYFAHPCHVHPAPICTHPHCHACHPHDYRCVLSYLGVHGDITLGAHEP